MKYPKSNRQTAEEIARMAGVAFPPDRPHSSVVNALVITDNEIRKGLA